MEGPAGTAATWLGGLAIAATAVAWIVYLGRVVVSNVIDKETQDKIDVIKDRLVKHYGYNEASANDVLAYVASIFARGDVRS